MTTAETAEFKYIVVGGGIAGVTCAETLSSSCGDKASILLLTASPLIKAVTNFRMLTKTLEEFDVEEQPMSQLQSLHPTVHVVHQRAAGLHADNKELVTASGDRYKYRKLCLCTGASPKVIARDHPLVLGIRDTETVKVFQKRLKNARRIMVVGNGGIATELVYEVEGCEVIWAVKDKSIVSTFIDPAAAAFCLPTLAAEKTKTSGPTKRTKYTIEEDVSTSQEAVSECADCLGSALGPDWSESLPMQGAAKDLHEVHVEYEVEVDKLLSGEDLKKFNLRPSPFPQSSLQCKEGDWPLYVQLTNGKVYGCDFLVSATGVVPNTRPFTDNNQFEVAEDGGIKVNHTMQTSVPDVYAAGDVCHASWDHSPHWLQMRLWSQARQMGHHAACCMHSCADGDTDMALDFCFEIFAHVTKFFSYKVILLGKFNAQGLGNDHELLLRMTEGVEYVKVVLKDGRMHGALLLGETDLEETFENLILNQTDLTAFKEDLLDPNIDIEDFFD